MIFDFFGDRKQAVVAMAHVGELSDTLSHASTLKALRQTVIEAAADGFIHKVNSPR